MIKLESLRKEFYKPIREEGFQNSIIKPIKLYKTS